MTRKTPLERFSALKLELLAIQHMCLKGDKEPELEAACEEMALSASDAIRARSLPKGGNAAVQDA